MQLPAPAKQLACSYSSLASDRRRSCTRLHRGCNDALLLGSRPSPALPTRHCLLLRLRHWIAPNIHYLNLPIILGRLERASAQEEARQGLPPKSRLIFRSLRVHTCSRQPVLVRSYLNAVIPALHLFCISQNFLRRYTASQQ